VNCAVCNNPMITLELDQVETDYCLSCRGFWLDGGELEQLLGNPEQVRQVLQSFLTASGSREAPRRCPICGKKMEKVLAGPESKATLLDRCQKGHGLWFDSGELESVLRLGRFDPEGKLPSFLKKMYTRPETKENPNPSE
jgi:Zn-finger nucleic acid-binding protein